MEKIRTSALKFVVLDYDKFSRTEFVADVAMPLEHINIDGEEETRPLCVVSCDEVSIPSLAKIVCNLSQQSRLCSTRSAQLQEIWNTGVANFPMIKMWR